MLLAVIVLQLVILLVVGLLLVRRQTPSAVQPQDPRHAQLPDQIAHLHARHEGLDLNLRSGLSELRREQGAEALATRGANAAAFRELRTEVVGSVHALGQQLHAGLDRFREDNAISSMALRTEVTRSITDLGQTLQTGLAAFHEDNEQAASRLRTDVRGQHEAIGNRLQAATAEARLQQDQAREALHTRLTELAQANAEHQERLRTTVGESLGRAERGQHRQA